MKNFASLPQLIIFAKVAETGSLSKAAQELNITPSAVSKSLTLFESRMGVLLVKRTTRNTALTEHGQSFFRRVASILRDVEQALDELDSFKLHPKGILRVTCSTAFGSIQLMSLVGRYMDMYPEVDVHVSLDDRHANLGEEKFDLALRITTATDWNYTARKLAQVKWIYCASPNYLDAHGRPTSIEDIFQSGKHRFLAYPTMDARGSWIQWQEGELRHQVKVDGGSDCNSSLALMVATLNGTGIACLPTYIASSSVIDNKLEFLFSVERPENDQTLYAMYFQSRYTNPLIRTFIDFLVREIVPIPPWDRALREKVGTRFSA